jgi:hypothetical protein
MILDAILLALAEISSTEKRGVAILPEMRIAQGDGVQISHPVSGYALWLSGNVDYVVIEYEDVRDYKGEPDYHIPSLRELLHRLQTACSPLVDPERMHSISHKVACSSLKPNARVLTKA